jgi:hypothetical protein
MSSKKGLPSDPARAKARDEVMNRVLGFQRAFAAQMIAEGPRKPVDPFVAQKLKEQAQSILDGAKPVIQMRVCQIPERMEGKMPHLGVGPADYFGIESALDGEKDRVAREASLAGVLLGSKHSTPVQWAILERLVALSPDQKLKFPYVGTLKRFLTLTRTMDVEAANALGDDALRALWADAVKSTKSRRRPLAV